MAHVLSPPPPERGDKGRRWELRLQLLRGGEQADLAFLQLDWFVSHRVLGRAS